MQPGIYTFYSKAAGRYLSCRGRTLVLSPKPFSWELKPAGTKGAYLYAHNTQLLLDIDNAWVRAGNAVKVWPYTGYHVQVWTVARNPNGSFSILHNADPRYCLGFRGENAVLQLRDRREPLQEWTLTGADAGAESEYRSFFSKNRVVELRLPADIHKVIAPVRLQRWAEHLETAYNSFHELTGHLPFPSVTVEAWQPALHPGYAGWVYPRQNTIHADRDFLRRDLAKMALRGTDWNFCVLHEMGHMFDFDQPWNFEAELMTDLKVAYVLEMNNAAAAPAEFDAATCFRGAEIARAYGRLARDFSRQYDIFGCTKRFLDIKAKIGWEPFRNTFHYLYQNSFALEGASGADRFLTFVQTLSRCSGQDIRAYFSGEEWNTILRHLSK